MKQLQQDLASRLDGTISLDAAALDYFSTDGSIFSLRPQGVIYPYNTQDVVRTVEYLAGRAGAGHVINLTARGKGTDQAGGALGDGVMLVFPAHMNRLIRLGKDTVTVQPGILYKDLQNTLHTHGRFLPPYPSSIDFSTIGGAVANNACGEKTIKYGATRDFVQGLKVVLADGSQIETKRISARELNHKKGLATLEGEIYRAVDSILLDNEELIRQAPPATSKNSAGYALWRVKNPKDGSFDLSQLMVGSQGTLGVITEITLRTMPYNPQTTLVVGYFDDLEKAGQAVLKLSPLGPSAMEIVDENLIKFVQTHKPGMLEGLLPEQLPKIVILVEFDDQSKLRQSMKARKAQRILKKFTFEQKLSVDFDEQERLWKLRRSAAAVIWMVEGKKKALPLIEDGCVPVDKLPQFLDGIYKIFKKGGHEMAIWGHAGNANFHMQPWFDLSKAKDRTELFKLADEFYALVLRLGGTTCGEHNDGLMRAPYLKKLYGKEVYELFEQVKRVCDPYGFLNNRVKLGVTQEDIKPLLRHEYSMKHLYDHMPHT